MEGIRMVDLKTQYDRIRGEINAAIQEVLDSTAFINGPAVGRFQKNLETYLQCKHVIPCANGTDALTVALMALDLQPGDEVITPSFTFIATAEVIELLRLKPVFIDVDKHTFTLDVQQLEQLITPRTKCIIPVHLFGQCADMEPIMQIARKYNIYVVEDACQSIGAEYKFSDGMSRQSGTMGHIGCTSFFPSKNLGAYGDGGALFTNDDVLAEKLRSLVNHGMKVRYYHDYIGVNSRLDSIQAAILDVKLKYLDQYIKARQQAAKMYSELLSDIEQLQLPTVASYSTHVFHQYTIVVREGNRDELVHFLNERQVPTMIYYPVPIHLQKAYRHLGYKRGDLPITEYLSEHVFSLPMHTELTVQQITYICDNIRKFFGKI